jgi:hypothetical protein
MGAFLAALGLVGTGVGAYGQYQAGRQQRKVAEMNARIIQQQSASEATLAHERARRMKAEQVAAFAKTGAELGTGTPLMVLAEQAGEMERDILERRRVREIQAQNIRFEGRQAERAAKIGAFTTLLSGGARAGTSLAGGFGGGGGRGALYNPAGYGYESAPGAVG